MIKPRSPVNVPLKSARVVLFNKPYGVLSQFTPEGRWRGLTDYLSIPGVYPAGRLDADSEGLLLLTDSGALQHRLAHPKHKEGKVYLVQVEGLPSAEALKRLAAGVDIGDHHTLPCNVRPVEAPPWLWSRDPPIRVRKSVPDSWLEIVLHEGKNRQVRRMCAAVGFPVLRLIRMSIGSYCLDGLAPGEFRLLEL